MTSTRGLRATGRPALRTAERLSMRPAAAGVRTRAVVQANRGRGLQVSAPGGPEHHHRRAPRGSRAQGVTRAQGVRPCLLSPPIQCGSRASTRQKARSDPVTCRRTRSRPSLEQRAPLANASCAVSVGVSRTTMRLKTRCARHSPPLGHRGLAWPLNDRRTPPPGWVRRGCGRPTVRSAQWWRCGCVHGWRRLAGQSAG